MTLLDRDAILRGLSKIDARARAAGVIVDLAVYGGAALILAFDTRRATRDVDAVVRGAPDFLREAAAAITAEEGWSPDWLNDGAKGFTSARENLRLMTQFQASAGGGLRVYTPAPEYLFAMKCMAMRPEGWAGSHDISDIEWLAGEIGLRDAETALALVEAFYPPAGIPAEVRFGVEEIMERIAARRAAAEPEPGPAPLGHESKKAGFQPDGVIARHATPPPQPRAADAGRHRRSDRARALGRLGRAAGSCPFGSGHPRKSGPHLPRVCR